MSAPVEQIGRYQVVGELGSGGMGKVFLAKDPTIDRYVAIKLLQGTLDTEGFHRRFLREAQAVGRLRHPNIVTIFDVQEHEGALFIAMEYIPGGTLADLIERSDTISLDRKLEITEQLCAGLSCAHKAGVIHRDVKPANVMVDESGLVKIVDFGIAKSTTSQLTLTGDQQLLGTLPYMSPEQLGGKHLDHRSDMFSASVVAYELLTGRRAFSGTLHEVASAILSADVPPMSRHGGAVPPAIERIVFKGLSKRPDDRFVDMGAMQRDLAEVRRLLATAAPAPNRAGADRSATPMPATVDMWEAATRHVDAPDEVARRGASASPDAMRVPHGMFGSAAVDGTEVSGETSQRESPSRATRATIVAGAVLLALLAGWTMWPSSGRPLARRDVADTATGAASTTPAAGVERTPSAPDTGSRARPDDGKAVVRPPRTKTSPAATSDVGRSGSDRAQQELEPPRASTDLPVGLVAPVPAPPAIETAASPASPSVAAPSPRPTAAPTLSADDEFTIRGVLAAFQAAFEDLSSTSLQRLQPSLTAEQLTVWDRAFADNDSYRLAIVNPKISLVSTTRARVDCALVRTIASKITGSVRTLTTKPATVVLDKSETGWTISSVRGQGW